MQTKDAAQYAIGMRGSRAFVAMGQLKAVGIFAVVIMCAIVGRKRQMVNQIEDMKNKIDELSEMVKIKSDENDSLKAESKALKQRVEYLKNIFEKTYASEKPEDVMRKTGLFSEEEIQAHMRSNETIWKNMKETISENAVSNDTLIAKLKYQHQQDCIRINDLTTTVHVLAGMYSTLRKNVGMD